jgi:Fe(II)/alpha-ketoglutarate-dependent arginine beta-hydroxylase
MPAMGKTAERERFVIRHELTAGDAAEALGLARRCADHYRSVADPRFLTDVAVLADELPLEVRRFANEARLDDAKHVAMLAGNLICDVGPTPLHWRDADTAASRPYAFLLMLYATLFGDAVGWATQQDGRMVADVLPTPGDEHKILNSCSERALAWHSEDSFSPYRADYVGLLCLRSRDATPTTISYADPSRAPAGIAATLAQERFVIRPDNAHDPANNSTAGHGAASSSTAGSSTADRQAFERLECLRANPPRVALLSGHPQAPALRIDRDFTTATDAESARALRWLVAHLDENLYDLPMTAGDVCFIDNRNAVHGRRPFLARYDGTDRWLKRTNVVSDLRHSRPARRSAWDRVIG